MSLQPLRQTEQTNICYPCPWTQERGGCATVANISGVYMTQYVFNPSGAFVAGIQLNDIEYMNLGRQYQRTYTPGVMTDLPCGIGGIAVQGDFITDWIHLIGTVMPGDPAYAGPSGTFTNSTAFGGNRIGKFIGVLESDPHVVTMRGLGFDLKKMDPCTKQIVHENNPAHRVLVITPGYIKIRIDIGAASR